MATTDSIPRAGSTTSEVGDEKNKVDFHQEEVAVAKLTEDDLYRISQEALKFKGKTAFRICLIMFVMGCNQAGFGVDWAVISGINAFPQWHEWGGFESSGHTFGVITALMTVGTFVGAYFLSLQDVVGRRGVLFVGNSIVIASGLMQGLAPNVKVLMAGRFILGFGSALMSSSQYMAEIAPMHLRGRLVGIFGACFQVGSVVFLAVMNAFKDMESDWSWRIPLLLECLMPAIVCATIFWWCPESPRYYIQKNQHDKARKVIAKYMTNSGQLSEPIVNIMVTQIEESIEFEKADRFRKFWDYRVFFTKPVRFRFLVLILYSIFQSWNGGGIIGTFLVPALETMGVSSPQQLLGINIGTTGTYFVFTLVGAYIIDKFKRRTLIFAGLISVILMQVLSTITGWRYAVAPNEATSAVAILWVFLFQILSSMFIATMHNLYPVEILSLTLRARGMGLYGMIQGAAGTVQNYGISVGINKLGYKIWVVYIVYNCIQLVAAYFLFPETFGLGLEEIDAVFETNGVHPVKMSLNIQKIKKEQGQGLYASSRGTAEVVETPAAPEVGSKT